MKDRLKNWITTLIGALLMLTAVGLYMASKFKNYEISTIELASVATLGWVFLTARDTLLEGVFLNVFKIKPKQDNGSDRGKVSDK